MSTHQLTDEDYELLHKKFSALQSATEELIKRHLDKIKIKHAIIKSRVKNKDSLIEKIQRKSYEDVQSQCTDILGLRIVTYLEDDISKADSELRELFEVLDHYSIDKRQPDNSREFGYRSLHLICKLGERRKDLPEYRDIHDLHFEVQIRTALQDTWAEIEHVFNYKSDEALPRELERKLFRASALLETVDDILQDVSDKARSYFLRLSNESPLDDSDPITKIGLLALVEKTAKNLGIIEKLHEPEKWNSNESALKELKSFGITSTRELEDLFLKSDSNLMKFYANSRKSIAPIHLARTAMIFQDPEKYLSAVDTSTLSGVSRRMTNKLKEKFPDIDIESLLDRQGIPINEDKK